MLNRRIILFALLHSITINTLPVAIGQIKSDKLIEETERINRAKLDSLKLVSGNAGNDTTEIKTLNEISHVYHAFSYDSSLMYAMSALQKAERLKYAEGIVNAITNCGMAEEVFKKNWDTAVIYYKKAIEAAKKYRLERKLDELYAVIHNSFVYQGNFPSAMNIANEGLTAASRRNDKRQMLHYTSLVAAAYFRQNLYEKALSEYKKAEVLAGNLGDAENASLNLVTLADVYYGMGNVYTQKGDSARALYYLNKAFAEFISLENNPNFIRHYMVSNTLYKTGVAYRTLGDLHRAFTYAQSALDSCKNGGCNLYEKAEYYVLAGDALTNMDKYDEARTYLYEGKRIAEEIRHAENARDAYNSLSVFYARQKMYDSAWVYNRRYTILKDSIINERTRFRTEEIDAIYDIAEKDRQIARQNNQRNILVSSFIVLLLTLAFLYNRYRLRQKNRYQQELNRQQNELFNAIAAAQEEERKRIAQDIHDGLGSVLSAAKLKMEEVKEIRPELAVNDKFLSGVSLIDEASSELRNISHNIMPATLSKLGLVPALKNLSEKISSHKGLQVQFIAHEFERRTDEQTEISIYRIVMELLNNVVKHAGATKAIVQLVQYPDNINITVEDNGKGFEASKVSEDKTGIGLGSVLARVEYLKGKMEIDSKNSKGTTVIIDIPLKV